MKVGTAYSPPGTGGVAAHQENAGRVGSAERSPSSNRTCRFPASGSHGSLHPNAPFGNRGVRMERCLRREKFTGITGSSVVGITPNGPHGLLQQHVSVQPLRSTVITRFPATMGCPTPAKTNTRVSQVPRLFFPHALPPTTPESPMAASPVARPSMAGFIRFDRLATPIRLTRLNRVRFTAARKFASQGFVTWITPIPHACSATLMNGLFQE